MGNRRKAYKPNSRTRQKRTAARRDVELEELESEVTRDAPAESGSRPVGQPMWRRFVNLERRPPSGAERDMTPWSQRGLATMSLVAAVVCLPLGIVQFFTDKRQYSLAAYVVAVINPAALIPFFLVLSMLLAMPLARALAREPRSLRILETLGYAATVQILLIFFWSPVYQVNSHWYDNGKGVIAGAAADVLALALGALVYGPVSRWLTRRRPNRPR